MNKKAFFFSVELYYKEQNVVCNFKKIPDLLKEIIDTNGIVNDGITTLDLTGVAESLHTMLDVYRYKDNYFLLEHPNKDQPELLLGEIMIRKLQSRYYRDIVRTKKVLNYTHIFM